MITLDQQSRPRPAPQPMPQPMVPQGAAAGQQAAGPAVLFRQPQPTAPQPQMAPAGAGGAAGAAGVGPGQPGPGAQSQPQRPMTALERFQLEQAKLQELYGIIGQAQAKLDAVRAAMGKKPETGTQYEQAVKGSGHGNR